VLEEDLNDKNNYLEESWKKEKRLI